jgi:CRISPR/Cas system Type II protein with McrA/HNH and RuvC-like nuclease domain
MRCFISGEVIVLGQDEVEYDHILPYAKQGETDLSNIRIVKKEYNRRKSDQTLYEVRDNLKLDQLFIKKKNQIKLQDIFALKNIVNSTMHCVIENDQILIDDGIDKKDYFYCLMRF